MRGFYPEIEPYESGHLEVGDGQRVYWETSGNPDGKPVVFLHGGPGGGTSPTQRRLFDPERYRIILVGQRGAGRSTPHASEPDADPSSNTTWHLVADLELLREHLGIDRWQVFGGSWGSSLALAYAEKHTERVTELVLRGIFNLRQSELDWFYEGGAAELFPDTWEDFLAPVPEAERSSLIAASHRLLNDPDPVVHGPAAVAWSTWEASGITLLPQPEVVARFAEPTYALASARMLWRPRVIGKRNVPKTGPVFLASNHLSFMDSVVITLGAPRSVSFLAKAEYFTGRGIRGRISRSFFSGIGAIPVVRGGGSAAQAALYSGLEVLERGDAFAINPEGTRSLDGRLGRLRARTTEG